MRNCGIVINVSDVEYIQNLGALGNFVIPACREGEKFAILVVEPRPEIHDDGFGKSHSTDVEGATIARDVAGLNSDQRYVRFGVHVCQATPELPREIEQLEFESQEMHKRFPRFYDAQRNLVDNGIKQKQELADKLHQARDRFTAKCMTLITPAEISAARNALIGEAKRLVAEADLFWAQPGNQKLDISDRHRRAAVILRQPKPWAYIPSENEDCPGCGKPQKVGIARCGDCGAILDEEKCRKIYPELFMLREPEPEPVGTASRKK